MKTAQDEEKELYKGKKGGFLEIIKQNSNEREKNIVTYKLLADRGGKYSLVKELDVPKMKNPDAFNHDKGWWSEAKHPTTDNGKNAIQSALKDASKQQVQEVIIRLEKDYPAKDLHEGFRAGLYNGRGKTIQQIILIRKDRGPMYFDVEKLRERLF